MLHHTCHDVFQTHTSAFCACAVRTSCRNFIKRPKEIVSKWLGLLVQTFCGVPGQATLGLWGRGLFNAFAGRPSPFLDRGPVLGFYSAVKNCNITLQDWPASAPAFLVLALTFAANPQDKSSTLILAYGL